MDSFVRYISTSNINNRTFLSNSPGPAILIWSNSNRFPDITGVSLVESNNAHIPIGGITGYQLSTILQNQLNNQIPFLHIIYDWNLQYMDINQQRYSIVQSAYVISQNFGVQVGNISAKQVNNTGMVTDPFHVWSRNVFHGHTVKKTDLDMVVLNQNQTQITSLVEVKRSNRPPVGTWRPYISSDRNNYIMMMGLSNYLNANFYTVHHDDLNTTRPINSTNNIDVFTFRPNFLLPNQQVLNQFASANNRNLTTVANVLNIF